MLVVMMELGILGMMMLVLVGLVDGMMSLFLSLGPSPDRRRRMTSSVGL